MKLGTVINSLWNGSDGIETYFTKLRNKAITEYDKTFKKRSDTKQRFCDYISSHIEPISNIIKKICDYIETDKNTTVLDI